MAIDAVSIALSPSISPVANDSLSDLVCTATTKLSGSNADATRVEFTLMHASMSAGNGQGALKEVKSFTKDTSSSPTGVYAVTFAKELMNEPGLYSVKADGIVGGGSPEVISNRVTAMSAEILVTEAGPQTLDQIRTEVEDHETRITTLED